MENSGRATEVGVDGRKIVESRGKRQPHDSKRCASTGEVFGGTETNDISESTP